MSGCQKTEDSRESARPCGIGSGKAVSIWYVKIGDDGLPLIIEARDRSGNPLPGEIDLAVYILPQDRSYGFSQNLFKSSDGTIDIRWPDGRASGLRVEVLTTDLTEPILRVRTR